jgi:hypothetical protein
MTNGYAGPERRARQSPTNGLPLWAHVTSVIGFPILVAAVLLGMLTGYVTSPISRTATALENHVRDDQVRTRIMRVMCRHGAAAMRQNADDCDVRENP